MLTDWAVALGSDFGDTASYFILTVFLSALPFCIYKQRWPQIDQAVALLVSSWSAISGIKIFLLALLLPSAQLGLLANDKPALILGAVVLILLSLKGAMTSWRMVAFV
jgi:hypothetical protein